MPKARTACTYDNNGNITSDGTRSFTYDDENQLTSVSSGTTYRHDFVYDGLGRKRKRLDHAWNGSSWAVNAEIRYLYDGRNVIQERFGDNTPTVAYTRGWDLSGSFGGAGGIGGMLARSHGYSSGTWSTHNGYHADGNGNITAMVSTAQALTANYKYDPYGNLISSSGTIAGANNYRFSSKEWVANPGLYYYGFRFYHVNLQRWLNQDPLGEHGDINLYGFATNSPINYIDAEGELAFLLPALPAIINSVAIDISGIVAAIIASDILEELLKHPPSFCTAEDNVGDQRRAEPLPPIAAKGGNEGKVVDHSEELSDASADGYIVRPRDRATDKMQGEDSPAYSNPKPKKGDRKGWKERDRQKRFGTQRR